MFVGLRDYVGLIICVVEFLVLLVVCLFVVVCFFNSGGMFEYRLKIIMFMKSMLSFLRWLGVVLVIFVLGFFLMVVVYV